MVTSRAGKPRRTWRSHPELHEYLKGHEIAGRWRADVIDDVVEHETMELPDGSIDIKWSSDTFNSEDRRGDYHDLRTVLRDMDLPVLFITSEKRRTYFQELEPLASELPEFSTADGEGHRPQHVHGAARRRRPGNRVVHSR